MSLSLNGLRNDLEEGIEGGREEKGKLDPKRENRFVFSSTFRHVLATCLMPYILGFFSSVPQLLLSHLQ